MVVPDNTPKVIFSHLKTDTTIDLLPFSPCGGILFKSGDWVKPPHRMF